MRILYGVVGEGMGHATRSSVVLEHLHAAGHDVQVMTSGRAKDFLASRFEGVNEIHGLHFVTEQNRVRMGKSLWSNVIAGAAGIPQNVQAYFDLIHEFRPEIVVSDFESWTYIYAKAHGLPVISVDNMQVINRCRHPDEILDRYEASFDLAKAFVKSKLPFANHYLVTSFFRPPLRKKRTTLLPPILRPSILEAQRSVGEHLLVYQTAEGNETLAQTLKDTGLPCRVYGMRRGLEADLVEGNLVHRPFSESGFIEDLASARAVVAGGGFTVMSECVYLHKPMLSVPIRAQFEQVLNARWLERLGYGRFAKDLRDPAVVHEFLEAVPACEEQLAGYTQDGNRELLAALDEQLDRAAAGV
ncbi:MAG: teichoic acid biosynthesis protein [Nannocystaceae bacterium]|nr:teichoic acid biosynthesis protein [Nannocystaceae bacterium]